MKSSNTDDLFNRPMKIPDQPIERHRMTKHPDFLPEHIPPMPRLGGPDSELSFAIKTQACDLREVDPLGIGQHEPGAKLDAGKPMADLLLDFGRALLSVAEVGTYGAYKYTRGGWQHVPDGVNRYSGALLRHLLQEKMESFDQETKLLHASHAAWNSLARLELLLREREREQLLKERESNNSLHTTDKTSGEN